MKARPKSPIRCLWADKKQNTRDMVTDLATELRISKMAENLCSCRSHSVVTHRHSPSTTIDNNTAIFHQNMNTKYIRASDSKAYLQEKRGFPAQSSPLVSSTVSKVSISGPKLAHPQSSYDNLHIKSRSVASA